MPKSAPIVVRYDSVRVKIYPNRVAGRTYYRIVYKRGGQRVVSSNPALEGRGGAREVARGIAKRLASGSVATSAITPTEAEELQAVRPLLNGAGLSAAVREWAEARAKLGGVALAEAVRFYQARHPVACERPSALLERFLEEKKADGTGSRQLVALRQRCRLFADSFPLPFHEITAPQIEDWLRGLQQVRGWSGRSRNHYRSAVSAFASWARRKGHLPRAWQELEFVEKALEEDGEIQIYTPDEGRRLLDAADARRRPYFVLAMFCGLRRSEIFRLRWEDVNLKGRTVFVGKGKVRTAGHRLVPLPAGAVELLRPHARAEGQMFRCDADHFLDDTLTRAGVVRKGNALRRSFISYRLALTQDIGKVSEETGTSPGTLRRRYCRPVEKAAARAWFGLCAKGVQMSKGGNGQK